jgi:serine/threonine protein kinase
LGARLGDGVSARANIGSKLIGSPLALPPSFRLVGRLSVWRPPGFSTMDETKLDVRDGKILIDNDILNLSGMTVERKISQGKNGVLFEAVDNILNRRVAIKIWVKLKAHDKRDKLRQGLLEAQKACQAQGKGVVQVYSADIVKTRIYGVMEYIDGRTLLSWLSDEKPSLGRRFGVAWSLMSTLLDLETRELYHGDLHVENVLIYDVPVRSAADDSDSVLGIKPALKVIDFGTSYFAGRKFSFERHYRLMEKTFDELLRPFSLGAFYGRAQRPDDYRKGALLKLVEEYVVMISASLIYLGVKHVSLPPGYGAHPDLGFAKTYFDNDDGLKFKAKVQEILREKPLSLEESGDWWDWNAFQNGDVSKGGALLLPWRPASWSPGGSA